MIRDKLSYIGIPQANSINTCKLPDNLFIILHSLTNLSCIIRFATDKKRCAYPIIEALVAKMQLPHF